MKKLIYRIMLWHTCFTAWLTLDVYGDKRITSCKEVSWSTPYEDVANEMLRRCKESKLEYYDPETGKFGDVKWYIKCETEEV